MRKVSLLVPKLTYIMHRSLRLDLETQPCTSFIYLFIPIVLQFACSTVN